MLRLVVLCALLSARAAEGETPPSRLGDLPTWIADDPAFLHPLETDSIAHGNGSLATKEKKSLAWVVYLNEERGHGVHVDLEKLSLDPDRGDFLMVAPWPLAPGFKQAKLFTGSLRASKVRFPNTRSFVLLYSTTASTASPEMVLSYRRYGVSYEPKPRPTDGPIKKETVFEVHFKGKTPEEYGDPQFLMTLKEAMRTTARRYSLGHGISFDDGIPTNEMVSVRRVSFCPFEWPDRDICCALEHSIFVSGTRVSEELIMDYELTADHLRDMWLQEGFPELEALGVTVYKLPTTSNAVLWWALIIGLTVVSSLIASFVFWRTVKYRHEESSRKSSAGFERTRPKKKGRPRLAKNQEIPAFMFSVDHLQSREKFQAASYEDLGNGRSQTDLPSFRDSSGLPIKNYFGSILFGAGKASEDSDENVEFRRK